MVSIEMTYHAIASPAKIQAIFLLLLCFGLLKIFFLRNHFQATHRVDGLNTLFNHWLLGKAVVWRWRRQCPFQADRTIPYLVCGFLATTGATDDVVHQQQL